MFYVILGNLMKVNCTHLRHWWKNSRISCNIVQLERMAGTSIRCFVGPSFNLQREGYQVVLVAVSMWPQICWRLFRYLKRGVGMEPFGWMKNSEPLNTHKYSWYPNYPSVVTFSLRIVNSRSSVSGCELPPDYYTLMRQKTLFGGCKGTKSCLRFPVNLILYFVLMKVCVRYLFPY